MPDKSRVIVLQDFVNLARRNTLNHYHRSAVNALYKVREKSAKSIRAELTRAFKGKSEHEEEIIDSLAEADMKMIMHHLSSIHFILNHRYTDTDVETITLEWD